MSIEVITMEGTAKFEGDVGPRGLPGPQGEQGIPGAPGSPGRDGTDGRDGIDGQDAKINGVNTLTITAGDNVHISQTGSTMTISSDMYDDTEVKQDITILENDVDGLDNSKQDKQDEALDTINKIVVNAINEIFSSVGGIQALIPNQASATNQVADKDFVNSSLNSIAAFYITKNAQGDPFSTKAELTSATVFYSGGEVRVPTRNDYCVVLADESKTDPVTLENPTTRYIFQNSQWEYQYTVNKTALTANQLAAINSGITQALVALISTNQTNIATIMADYIKSTDYATSSKGGVIKTSANSGTGIANGILNAVARTFVQYSTDSDNLIVGKKTLENVFIGKGLVKSTTISSDSTDDNVVTPKAVYNYIQSLDGNGVAY